MGEGLIVRRGISKPPPWGNDALYYWEGEEFVEKTGGWGNYIQSGSGSATKENNHLKTDTAQSNSNTTWTFSTENKIDLSDINTLYIQWENQGDSSNFNYSTLFISNAKNDPSFVARTRLSNAFNKKIDSLDVSGLSGSYSIHAGGQDGDNTSARRSIVKIYKVWGEK